jgi:hypothetical protein
MEFQLVQVDSNDLCNSFIAVQHLDRFGKWNAHGDICAKVRDCSNQILKCLYIASVKLVNMF